MKKNFLNISQERLDKPIYRIISIERLFELFRKKKNTLVRPKLWDDPFENFIMNSTGELEDGTMFSVNFRNHFYAQCWTKTRESDAMWRIYSPDKRGVRISSTPRKLLKSLYDTSGEFRDISCFIGSVRYYSTPKLLELLQKYATSWITDTSGAGQAQTLLFKRIPFKHENEVRLIYNSNGNINLDLFKYSINPYELIDSIIFDPRIEYKEFKDYKLKLRKIGFKKRIVKSNLYKAPELKFRFDK